MINIGKQYTRYLLKNTVSGKYQRHLNRAQLNSILTGLDIIKTQYSFNIEDVGLTSFFATFALRNIKLALQDLKNLKPIKKRALNIKKIRRKNSPNKLLEIFNLKNKHFTFNKITG